MNETKVNQYMAYLDTELKQLMFIIAEKTKNQETGTDFWIGKMNGLKVASDAFYKLYLEDKHESP